MNPRRLAESIIPIVTLLFFLQALRVIFSVMFGFIYDQVFEGPMNSWIVVSNLLVFAALLLPGWVNRAPSWRWISGAAFVASAARVALSIDDPWVRYWGALLILVSVGVFSVPLLRLDIRRFLRWLIIAVVIEQLLRILGHTIDISLGWEALPILAIWMAILMTLVFWTKPWSESGDQVSGGISWGTGAALGAFLFLETSLLSLPNGIARWSDVSYTLVAPLLVVITILPLFPGVLTIIRSVLATKFIRLMVEIIAIGGLLLGYFLSGPLAMAFLLLSQWVLLCTLLFLGELEVDESNKVGGRLALGLLLFLLLNFLNAFAFTYAYTLPALRGMGWTAFLGAGLLFIWGLLSGSRLGDEETAAEGAFRLSVLTMIAFAIVLVSVWPSPRAEMPEGRRRIATYNIHYGYDDLWHTTLPEIAAVLRASEVDVVALQEVDTGRMTSYSTDNAYYLARSLGMNVYYMPNVEHLTGIAVLYKGEALRQGSKMLPSLQEQTGIIEVVLPWGEQRVSSYGIWMGLSNEDTMRQVQEALAFIGPSTPATFGGDFNAEIEDPEMRAIMDTGFVDPFSALGQTPAPPTSPAVDPQMRIDFVWLRDLEPHQATVNEALTSDHRLVVVEVNPP
ncbi:MAG: endonuclease/exonuclease/phosphatase family protein [Anaerolineales bacterium]|jgi:endonuclease/exonuclease/phosphatase family metal-dependent hydrolase